MGDVKPVFIQPSPAGLERGYPDIFSSLTWPEKSRAGEFPQQGKILQRHFHVGFALSRIPHAKLERYFHRGVDLPPNQDFQQDLESRWLQIQTVNTLAFHYKEA